MQHGAALLRKTIWAVQKTFGRPLPLGSKRPFPPSPTTLLDLPFSGNFPGPGLPNLRAPTPFVHLEAEKPTQNPEIPKKKTPRSHELFRKVRANSCLLSCDTKQEPNGNCSEKLVQMNVFYFGWIFSGWIFLLSYIWVGGDERLHLELDWVGARR